MNVKVVSRHVGSALLVSALFMFLSVVVSILNGRDSALAPLLISFIITVIVGSFPFIFVRKSSQMTLNEGFVTIVFSWLLSFVFGMLPYALWGGPFTVSNAWFESVSGFTATGATILDNVEALPKSLLFWRSSTHFIGGLGVVVFLLLAIPSSSQMRLRLSAMEVSALSKDTYRARSNRTIHIFTYVYLALNVFCFIAFLLAGMPVFDSLCHAMSVCATGGFSTRTLSIGAYGSVPVTLVTMAFMFLASLHFGMLYIAVVTRSFRPLNNSALKFYLGMLVLFTLFVTGTLKAKGIEPSWSSALLNGSFHVMSYASSSGFAIADNSTWPVFPSALIMIGGLVCGMAGSTNGGIKSDRVLMLCKAIKLNIVHMLHPSSVEEMRMGRRPLQLPDYYPQVLYVAMFFLVLAISTLVCLAGGVNNTDAFVGSLASLTNVGPAIGPNIGSLGSYNSQPVFAKFMYTLDMFMGRIEIFPLLAAISMIFPSKKH